MKYKFLNGINTPFALKSLKYSELEKLASELRDYMVRSVSVTGGHLASSLGAVEITIALYRAFEIPKDKVIWDVGHQAYAHKILTGRRDAFKTLRSKGGISGFLKPSESKYDIFGAGHTSTSISAAMGFAKARDMHGDKNSVVAVLGDASLANGMSFEAINNIGHDKTNMLVVVIDNEMSISPTVGALSNYMNNIMTGNLYNKLRGAVKFILDKMPAVGEPTANIMKQVEEGVKGVISPGMIFENLGLRYFGPIQGHNIRHLEATLLKLKKIDGPKMMHIITKKGKGYGPAEKNPTLFHGIGKFNHETGEPVKTRKETYSTVFAHALTNEARKNRKLCVIVAAMIEGTNLSCFRKKYPKRFFDVGIAEEHAVTFAAGLAQAGKRPVVAIYSTFMQRAVDQIIHDAALHNAPIIFAMDRAGIVGEDGPTHHGVFDIAFMRMVPGMVVSAPSDSTELRRAVAAAAKYDKGPFSIRFSRGAAWSFGSENAIRPVRIGSSRIIRKGSAVTILSLGTLLPDVLEAADLADEILKKKAEIIDARFAKPFDREAVIKSVKKTGALITVEEGVKEGGFGQAVAAMLQEEGLGRYPVVVMGIPDRFAGQGTMKQVRSECGLSAKHIYNKIKEII